MAFVENNNQQLSLNDSTFTLTEREKKVLEKSWAKSFAEKVFPSIDESIFSALYSSNASRPNTPVNVIVGALILKEALGDDLGIAQLPTVTINGAEKQLRSFAGSKAIAVNPNAVVLVPLVAFIVKL